MKKAYSIVTILLMIIFLTAGYMPAQAAEKLEVAVNQSRVLTFFGVEKVAVANPEIADVIVVSGSELLLVGKASGTTTLHVWSSSGRQGYIVDVAKEDTPIAGEIQKILGYPDIRVTKLNKTVILEGTVNDQYQKARAEKVAGAYAEKVVNLLELTRPVQIKIEARILEINRELANNVGIKWGYNPASSPGTFGFGQSFSNRYMPDTLGKLGTFASINAQIDALVKDGIVKILSQPNMITLSGDKANIMVGGEIPVPVGLDNGKITIEWKEYGIKLDVAPEVNAEGLISSKVKAEVSTLDWNDEHRIEIAGSLKIPPIKTRKAETAIALSSGQTMAIGGLISAEIAKDVTRLPLLSNIPVLGKLFTSKSFNRGETELIILITPTIVNPAEYVPAATGEMNGFIKENPWGEKKDGRQNKSTDRR